MIGGAATKTETAATTFESTKNPPSKLASDDVTGRADANPGTSGSAAGPGCHPPAWIEATMAARRASSSPFFTGIENSVEAATSS